MSNAPFRNFGKKGANPKLFKKIKNSGEHQENVVNYSNAKVAKRIKKTSNDEAYGQQLSMDGKINQKGCLTDKNFHSRSNFYREKPEILNAFIELNLFHKMMKDYQELFDEEKS